MAAQWQPFQEPIRQTLFRTVVIAFVVGGAIAVSSRKWSGWPPATPLVLGPSFGGHWVEVWFLNWLRPHLLMQLRGQPSFYNGRWCADAPSG